MKKCNERLGIIREYLRYFSLCREIAKIIHPSFYSPCHQNKATLLNIVLNLLIISNYFVLDVAISDDMIFLHFGWQVLYNFHCLTKKLKRYRTGSKSRMLDNAAYTRYLIDLRIMSTNRRNFFFGYYYEISS